MRGHHTGSGRRAVMSPDWESTHVAVATGFMNEAIVHLRKPGGTTTWNDATEKTDTVPFTPFASNVPAQITPLTAGQVGVVEEKAWVLGYRVSVPYDTAPTSADLDEGVEVYVASCAGDPMLVGKTLRVNEIVRGVHRFERDLIADLNS